jgi:predicted permease
MTSSWILNLRQNLRQALRALFRAPGFALVTTGTLGLAIGANAVIFSVVDTVLLEPLPYSASDRLVHIEGSAPGSDMPEQFGLAAEFLVHYREHSKLLEDLAFYNSFTNTLRVDDRVERIRMSAPTISVFATLGVTPILGRLPVPEDEDRVVVLSHALWSTWFGADPEVLGRSYTIGGKDRTVIGVMGPEFWFPNNETKLWLPQVIRVEEIEPGRFGQDLVGRLAAELEFLARQLPERFGGSANYARLIEQHRPVIESLEEDLIGSVAAPLWILMGSVAIVLLIACANVANLFMIRVERRSQDLAVRRALGAGRGRLVTSQLAEAGLVAAFAGVLAVAILWIGTPLLLSAAPDRLPRLTEVAIGPATLLFTFALCGLSALLSGLVPALRFSAPNLAHLREGRRGSTRRGHWGRNALVVAQTALTLLLLISAALLLQSFDRLRDVDPGYDTRDVFTFQIAPETESEDQAGWYARFHLDFMKRLAGLPGVAGVGIVENVPLNEGLSGGRFRTEAQAAGEEGALLRYTWSAGDYFSVMGIEVFQGRVFTEDDHTTPLGAILVSRSTADLLWPDTDPIGQRLQADGQETWSTVVGVVDDVRQNGFREAPQPTVYFPLIGENPENNRPIESPAYVVKTARAEEIAPEVRALVREVAPLAPMYRVYTMEGLAERSMVTLSFTMLTLGIASLLSLFLGVVGLYGVLSYGVAERTREIGVRMALGAEASRVRRMIVNQGARVLAVGIAIGMAIALFLTRALGALLFGVEAFDPSTFLGVSVMMVLVGLAASYFPARIASKVDPIVSLRAE